MAWVKIDDQAPRHHKMLTAGPAACWLWVCGLAHCQSQLTDGFIAVAVLPMIGIKGSARAVKLADELVQAGLFDRVDGGYQVHDYLAYNPTRASVLSKRADDAERKRQAESGRSPRGVQAESGRNLPAPAPARAHTRVPSHPIPSSVPSEQIATRVEAAIEDARTNGRALERARDQLAATVLATVEETLAMRAGALVEHYGELFRQHRGGARYHSRIHLDFMKAQELVKTWADDGRLEKLAVIVLTTDDDWIAGTDRGFGVFAAKASWADDKLTTWEAEHGTKAH